MNRKNYLACREFFAKRPILLKTSLIIQKTLEIAVYIIYPLFLAYLIFSGNLFWIKSALVCGVGFLAVSFFRMRVNSKRPYEKYECEPLIKRDKKGRSFPSRHVFSAAIIAVSVAAVFHTLGIVLFAAALLIGFLRVVLGVHFIKDVIFGLVLGIALGLVVLI